jgi:hypothetical protein
MNLIDEIVSNAYETPEQVELERKEFELLLGENTVADLLKNIIENNVDKNFELIEKWIFDLQTNKQNRLKIGNKLHNFCDLLDFSYQFSRHINPNPFLELFNKMESLREKYPRFGGIIDQKHCKI